LLHAVSSLRAQGRFRLVPPKALFFVLRAIRLQSRVPEETNLPLGRFFAVSSVNPPLAGNLKTLSLIIPRDPWFFRGGTDPLVLTNLICVSLSPHSFQACGYSCLLSSGCPITSAAEGCCQDSLHTTTLEKARRLLVARGGSFPRILIFSFFGERFFDFPLHTGAWILFASLAALSGPGRVWLRF